jgi:hypothetical protein
VELAAAQPAQREVQLDLRLDVVAIAPPAVGVLVVRDVRPDDLEEVAERGEVEAVSAAEFGGREPLLDVGPSDIDRELAHACSLCWCTAVWRLGREVCIMAGVTGAGETCSPLDAELSEHAQHPERRVDGGITKCWQRHGQRGDDQASRVQWRAIGQHADARGNEVREHEHDEHMACRVAAATSSARQSCAAVRREPTAGSRDRAITIAIMPWGNGPNFQSRLDPTRSGFTI